MSKKSEKNLIEFIDSDDIQNVFTDIIQINVNNETVSIKTAIRDGNNETAKSSHNIILTIPHFLRFAEVCGNTASKILDQVKQIEIEHDNR